MSRCLISPAWLVVLAGCTGSDPQFWAQPQQPPVPQQQPWVQSQQPWAPPQPQAPAPLQCPPAAAAPPAGPRGLLTVHSQPAGAMVFWKGVLVGGTPLERVEVEAGTQQLLLVLPRYEPIFATATVRPGETTLQELAFPRSAPAVAPAPSRGGGDPPGGYGSSRCDRSDCQSACFDERFHCRASCYSNALCLSTCEQLENACRRGCDRNCR